MYKLIVEAEYSNLSKTNKAIIRDIRRDEITYSVNGSSDCIRTREQFTKFFPVFVKDNKYNIELAERLAKEKEIKDAYDKAFAVVYAKRNVFWAETDVVEGGVYTDGTDTMTILDCAYYNDYADGFRVTYTVEGSDTLYYMPRVSVPRLFPLRLK